MPPGRESKTLDKRQIERLKEFQRRMYLSGRGGSVPQLKLAMTGAPFKWGVLQKAMKGEPIWIMNYDFIREWLDRNVPDHGNGQVFDSKQASAGERDEDLRGEGSSGDDETGDLSPARLRSE